jgi:DNA polymerase delta subunit 2
MGLPDELLRKSVKDETFKRLERAASSYNPLHSFSLPHGEGKQYAQQFGDMYFLRLAKLKPVVEAIATEEWGEFEIAGEKAQRVERVLDVRQGQLCWVAGTIYMEMPMKPNILEDISKEHWIAGPPPRQSYFSDELDAQVMLEDESGRLSLTGAMLQNRLLVTGVIVAVLGTENANGEFEVLDMQLPDLPPQPQRWQRDDVKTERNGKVALDQEKSNGKKIAFVSGLDISGTRADTLRLALLSEYLLGEALGEVEQDSATKVSRLVIAGNSVALDVIMSAPHDQETTKKAASKKYGYDATAYNATPTTLLDHFLAELLPSIPITLLPGEHDPANVSLPQQGIHAAMFPHARTYTRLQPGDVNGGEPGWFDSVTNPWEGDIEGWRFLGDSGQPLDDILKYVEAGGPNGADAEGRLEVMGNMLRWRCNAPTAPDTLWCYPFQEKDQFVVEECPHVYFVGNQPRFDSTVIEGPAAGQTVRLVTIPRFYESGQLVLIDAETLEVELVQFDVPAETG